MKLDVFCVECGIKLIRYKKSDRKNDNHFCSKECQKTFKTKNKTKLTCECCSKSFYVYDSQTNRKFCSKKCFNDKNGTVGNISVVCSFCGKSFEKHRCYVNGRQNKKHFCSKECYNDSRKTNSPTTPKNYRYVALESLECKCSVCGWCDIINILDVHHIDGNRLNNEIENLVVLCPTHHAMVTRGYAEINNNKQFCLLEKKKHILKNVAKHILDSLCVRLKDLVDNKDRLDDYGFYAEMSRLWGCRFATARQIVVRFKNGDYDDLLVDTR